MTKASLIIAVNTYKECARSRIVYLIILFMVLLVGVSSLFGRITIGDQIVVVKSFGLFAISLLSVLFTVISGSSLVHKELIRRTIFTILSRPVSRSDFLMGKFLGLVFTNLFLITLMSIVLIGFLRILGNSEPLLFVVAGFYLFLESIIVCGSVIFFSSLVVTPLLSGLFAFGIFVVGRSSSWILSLMANETTQSSISERLIQILYWILPNLEKINVVDDLIYGYFPGSGHLLNAIAYVLGYSLSLLVISMFIFNQREFN